MHYTTINPESEFSPEQKHWYLRDSSEGTIQTSSKLYRESSASHPIFVADSLIYRGSVVPELYLNSKTNTPRDLVYFNVSETDSEPVSISVNWGDGLVSSEGLATAGGNGVLVARGGHSYAKPGNYEVSIEAKLSSGVRRIFKTKAIVTNSAFKLVAPNLALENNNDLQKLQVGYIPASGWNPPWQALAVIDQIKARKEYNPNVDFFGSSPILIVGNIRN